MYWIHLLNETKAWVLPLKFLVVMSCFYVAFKVCKNLKKMFLVALKCFSNECVWSREYMQMGCGGGGGMGKDEEE